MKYEHLLLTLFELTHTFVTGKTKLKNKQLMCNKSSKNNILANKSFYSKYFNHFHPLHGGLTVSIYPTISDFTYYQSMIQHLKISRNVII